MYFCIGLFCRAKAALEGGLNVSRISSAFFESCGVWAFGVGSVLVCKCVPWDLEGRLSLMSYGTLGVRMFTLPQGSPEARNAYRGAVPITFSWTATGLSVLDPGGGGRDLD